MKGILFLTSLLFFQSCSDNSSDYSSESVKISNFNNTLSGKGESYTYATFQDNKGNMYVGGNFKNDSADTNEFKDVSGAPLLGLSSTIGLDGYLMKLDKDGNQEWIKVIGGGSADTVQSVVTDGTNIYVVGKFTENAARTNGAVDFSGSNLAGVSGAGATEDIFVAKLNSDGEQQWIKILGGNDAGSNTDLPNSVIIDPSGFIYVGGVYYNDSANNRSSVDFGGAQLNGRSTGVTQDGFVAKLSTADGSQVWIKTIGGTGVDRVYRMAIDSDGAILVPGQYANTAANARSVLDFSNTTLPGMTTTNSSDGFIAKINSNGTQAWIHTYGGTTNDDFLDAAVVDGSNNVFVAGSFGNDTSNTAIVKDFAGNQLTGLTSTTSREVLLAKILSNGTQSWIKAMGGSGSDRAQGLGLDSSKNLYVAGYFNNNSANASSFVDFSGATLLGKSTGTASVDGFLMKLDTSGSKQWAKALGGTGSDVIEGMSVDSKGNVGTVGYMQNDTSNTNNVTDFKDEVILGRTSTIISTGLMVRYLSP